MSPISTRICVPNLVAVRRSCRKKVGVQTMGRCSFSRLLKGIQCEWPMDTYQLYHYTNKYLDTYVFTTRAIQMIKIKINMFSTGNSTQNKCYAVYCNSLVSYVYQCLLSFTCFEKCNKNWVQRVIITHFAVLSWFQVHGR